MKSADREHYGLAVYCARRFRERGVPMEELVSEAEAALLWAASRFDESRGVRFSTYAIPVVLGALRELCRKAAPMHVPRSEQRILTEAARAHDALCSAIGREPTVCEIAHTISVPAERLGQMLAAQERMRSIQDDADVNLAPDRDEFVDWVLTREIVRSLPRPYAQVLWLRLIAGASQMETAHSLGATQPQISRWEKQGREQLRKALCEE